MAVTTEAATIGVMIFLQYFAISPKVPSKETSHQNRSYYSRIAVIG